MCQTEPSVTALLYLQTSLSSVTNHQDEHEASAYRRCMHHLLVAGSDEDEYMGEALVEQAFEEADGEDAVMASSQDFAFSNGASGKAVDRTTWEERSATFQALLEFFPADLQQPSESLLDAVA
jgi:hypothetical protein